MQRTPSGILRIVVAIDGRRPRPVLEARRSFRIAPGAGDPYLPPLHAGRLFLHTSVACRNRRNSRSWRLSGFRRRRRQAAVFRIDNPRRAQARRLVRRTRHCRRRRGRNGPRSARLSRPLSWRIAAVQVGALGLGEEFLVAIRGRRWSGVSVRPDALQVRFAPGRLRRGAGGAQVVPVRYRRSLRIQQQSQGAPSSPATPIDCRNRLAISVHLDARDIGRVNGHTLRSSHGRCQFREPGSAASQISRR